MAQTSVSVTPGLSSFLKTLKSTPVEASIEHLISLLKRRQIRNSRPCAIATTALMRRVVGEFKFKAADELMERIRKVGLRLVTAQPREMVVGNIVRRVLALIREIKEDNAEDTGTTVASEAEHTQHDSLTRPALHSSISTFSPLRYGATEPMDTQQSERMADSGEISKRPPLLTSHTTYQNPNGPMVTSLFGIFSHPDTPSASSTPTGYQSPDARGSLTASNLERLGDASTLKVNLRAEVMDGIKELQDELEQSDEQIAENALNHIHSNEIILTHTASSTVQKFLLAAAKKRKFTVVHAEAYPNDHHATHATLLTGKKKDHEDDSDEDDHWKPLTAAGINVVLIPDSHVFAIMSRVNKVILATHTVLANGGLVAAAGARMIAKAAKVHQTPVVVLSGVYKLSPVYPFDIDELIEYGDAGDVIPYSDGDFVDKIDVENPLYDYVPADLVDLYITNIGGHAPSYLYRIVADHYRPEDLRLDEPVKKKTLVDSTKGT